jgi:putative transcriptional regulator
MKPRTIKAIHKEMAAVEKGAIAPGRVWVITKRVDGTMERRQVRPEIYQREKAKEGAVENDALEARRKLGVSQDRFAELLGISAATVRNWEQGRRKPTGAAKVLLRVAVKNPKAVLAAAA